MINRVPIFHLIFIWRPVIIRWPWRRKGCTGKPHLPDAWRNAHFTVHLNLSALAAQCTSKSISTLHLNQEQQLFGYFFLNHLKIFYIVKYYKNVSDKQTKNVNKWRANSSKPYVWYEVLSVTKKLCSAFSTKWNYKVSSNELIRANYKDISPKWHL